MVEPINDCGSCSMCCRIPSIKRVEGDVIFSSDTEDGSKPEGEWCQHCKPGEGGCSVYMDRGPTCQKYQCVWLQSQTRPGQEMKLALRPDKCKAVLQPTRDGMGIVFRVLPENWGVWRKGPLGKLLLNLMGRDGVAFATSTGGQRAALTPAAVRLVENHKETP